MFGRAFNSRSAVARREPGFNGADAIAQQMAAADSPRSHQADSRSATAPPQADSLPATGRLQAHNKFTPAQVEEIRRDFARNNVFMPVRAHAVRLLQHLQEPDELWPDGWPGGELRASHVMAVYLDLCEEEGWEPFPWQRTGEELRKILGCGRQYRSFYTAGRRQTLVVYPLPPARVTKIAAPAANDQQAGA